MTLGIAGAAVGVGALATKGVERENCLYTLGWGVFTPPKYASAFELIPGKRIELGVAAKVEGKKVEVVTHVRCPFESVTAGTRMIFAVL